MVVGNLDYETVFTKKLCGSGWFNNEYISTEFKGTGALPETH